MTTRDAIKAVQFWLDQSAEWWGDRAVCLALNRAVTEWVLTRYESGLSTERARRELGRLIPAPLTGTGSRILISGMDGVWLHLALDVRYRSADGGWQLPVACQPVSQDQVAVAKRSLFKRPTERYPLYTTQRQTGGIGEVIDILAPTPPDQWKLYYIRRPAPLSELRPDEEWADVPEIAQEAIIQIAKRMLMGAEPPDYSTQVQVEEARSLAPPLQA